MKDISKKSRQRGHTLIELSIVLATAGPVLFGLSALVLRQRNSNTALERQANEDQARARMLAQLRYQLRNAQSVQSSSEALEIQGASGSTRWQVVRGDLLAEGSFRGRLRGIEALDWQRKGQLARVALRPKSGKSWSITVYLRSLTDTRTTEPSAQPTTAPKGVDR